MNPDYCKAESLGLAVTKTSNIERFQRDGTEYIWKLSGPYLMRHKYFENAEELNNYLDKIKDKGKASIVRAGLRYGA